MIKKRYLVAFISVIVVVLLTTINSYQKSYEEYFHETQKTLSSFTESAQVQYDAVFKHVDNILSKVFDSYYNLRKRGSSETEAAETIIKLANISLYIDSINIGIASNDTYRFLGESSPDVDKLMDSIDKNGYSSSKHDGGIYGIFDYDEKNKSFHIASFNERYKDSIVTASIKSDILNEILSPTVYSLHGGYMFLLSSDGTFIYHKYSDLIGLNLLNDKSTVQSILNLDEKTYTKFEEIIENADILKEKSELQYSLNGRDKVGYYSPLKSYPGILFFTVSRAEIKKMQYKSLFRNVLPLFICLLIAALVLIKYIFLIKYTDYFTETKNENALIKKLHKWSSSDTPPFKLLLFKIESIMDVDGINHISDEKVFFEIADRFKKLNPKYRDIFRIFRSNYLFILDDDCNVTDFLSQLNLKIPSKQHGHLSLTAKNLNVRIDSLEDIKTEDIYTNLIKYMETNRERLPGMNSADIIPYSNILESMNKAHEFKSTFENALNDSSISLYFQPIVDLATGNIKSHEITTRLGSDEKNLLSNYMIELAEKEGLMHLYDLKVIQLAFNYYNKVLKNTSVQINLNINLSGQSINRDTLKYIYDKAALYYVNPSRITFELSESTAFNKLEENLQCLNELREKGFKLAIDHFGSGYAHVELLSKLEVDYVKIDWKFINGVEKNSQRIKTLNALVYLAKNYNARVIAEYVENRSCLEVLKKLEFDFAQGYYFGKPKADIDCSKKYSLNPSAFY